MPLSSIIIALTLTLLNTRSLVWSDISLPNNEPTISNSNCQKATDLEKAADCFAYVYEAVGGATDLEDFKNKSEAAYAKIFVELFDSSDNVASIEQLDKVCKVLSVMHKCYTSDFPTVCSGSKLSRDYVYYVTRRYGNPNGIFAFNSICSEGKLNPHTRAIIEKNNYNNCTSEEKGGFFLKYSFAYHGYMIEPFVKSEPWAEKSEDEKIVFDAICYNFKDYFNAGRVSLKQETHDCTEPTERLFFLKLTEKLPSLILNSCVKQLPYTDPTVSLDEDSENFFEGSKNFTFFGLNHMHPVKDKYLQQDQFRTCVYFQKTPLFMLYANYYVKIFGFNNYSLYDKAHYIQKISIRFYGKDYKMIDVLSLDESNDDINVKFKSGNSTIMNNNTNGPIVIEKLDNRRIRLNDENSGISMIIYKYISKSRVLYNFILEMSNDVAKQSYGKMMYGCLTPIKINENLGATGEQCGEHDKMLLDDDQAANILQYLREGENSGNKRTLTMSAMFMSIMLELMMQVAV